MKLNAKGYDLIKQFEGYSDRPYLCPAGIPTIGFGNTYYPNGVKVKLSDKQITRDYANEMLQYVADNFANDVLKVVKSIITQNQLNALTAFAYNLGMTNFRNSSLLKKVNANPHDPTIKEEFLKWNKSNGKILQGLINRRRAESNLYFEI
jgi:lysozyme